MDMKMMTATTAVVVVVVVVGGGGGGGGGGAAAAAVPADAGADDEGSRTWVLEAKYKLIRVACGSKIPQQYNSCMHSSESHCPAVRESSRNLS